MLDGGTKNRIRLVKIYKCGYCVNDLGLIYKEKRLFSKEKFYANSILLYHEGYGYILVDTGYNVNICDDYYKHKVYTFINPTVVSKEDTIVNQLKQDNIDVCDIKYIIISHFHPDHIGELKSFPFAKIITSKSLLKRSLKEILTFKEYIPTNIMSRLIDLDVVKKYKNSKFVSFFDDLILFFELNGHVKGQIGFIIPSQKIIFVADSCWRINEILGKYNVTFLTALIHKNIFDYLNSQKKVRRFIQRKAGYTIICSHDEKRKFGGQHD